MSDININHLQSWVGRERRSTDALQPFAARAMAAILNHPTLPEEGQPLPPTWHWLYFLEIPCATGPDGHPRKGDFLPPIPLARRMWAAGSLDVRQPLRLGVAAEKRTTIRSIDLKVGKSGTLVFLGLDHTFHQDGVLCLQEAQSLVYREESQGPVPLPAGLPAPAPAEWSRVVEPDPVLLFRYSALTYNAHRVHYDRNYATGYEHYPALVVHAPLLATLLVDLVLREGAATALKQFRFRAIRPTFDLGPIGLGGRHDRDSVQLWTLDHENHVGMQAAAVLESSQ